jgi:transposase
MFVVFPEFLDIITNISTKSAMYLIKHHPSPESIAMIGLEALSDKLRKVSRGQLGKDRAEELFRAAQSSVGIQEGKEGIFFEIAHLVFKIEQEDRFIDHMETRIQQYLQQIPYAFNILTIKGIGMITTAGLIGEVGDFKKFHTIAEITKLAGLDLFEISSGKHKGQRRISKRGRSLMRKLLFYAAVNVVKFNGIMHKRYHKMLDRGMPKMKALIAVSRRVLALIFAIVRDNTEYMEDYRRQHYQLAA